MPSNRFCTMLSHSASIALQNLYGRRGIDEMRGVKRVLDSERRLSPGVLFSRE